MSTRVLVSKQKSSPVPRRADAGDAAWRCIAWFGGVLAFIGLADALLVFYPSGFGDPSWEFAVVDAAVSSLPLLVMGLAAMVGAAVARRQTIHVRFLAASAVVLAFAILAAYAMYITTAPLALRVAPVELRAGIYKSIARVSMMSVLFGIGLITAAVIAFRSTRADR